MKKLLGLASCLCVAIALAFSSTGCGDKKDAKKDSGKGGKKTEVTLASEPSAWTGKPEEKGEIKLKLTREADAKEEERDPASHRNDATRRHAPPRQTHEMSNAIDSAPHETDSSEPT